MGCDTIVTIGLARSIGEAWSRRLQPQAASI
jgi:hypothetical protein